LAISKRLRYEVLKRDGHRCHYCGATAAEAKLVVDAVVPEVLGGSHKDPANLLTACDPCNNGKTSSNPDAPLVAAVAEDAARWSRAMTAAAGEMIARASEGVDAHTHFEKAWARYGTGTERTPLPKDPGWRQTVDNLLGAGLPMTVLEECIEIAMAQRRVAAENVFRYMCGVAWRKVGELRERASELVQDRPSDTGGPEDGAIEEWCQVILNQHHRADDIEIARKDCLGYTEGESPSSILWFLLQNLESERNSLQECLRDLLLALPDEIGKHRLDEHEAYYRENFGPAYRRSSAIFSATQWVTEDVALARARQEMALMPRYEYETWIQRARAENADFAEHLSEGFYVTEAARLAREAAAVTPQGGE
jgi:HNH endonuclease